MVISQSLVNNEGLKAYEKPIFCRFAVVKKYFQKAVSSFMAILLLLSTVSWTVDKHLCMGRVMDIALFASAEDCGMEAALGLNDTLQSHCCDDESFTLLGQDDLKLSWNDIHIDKQLILLTFATSFAENIEPQSSKCNSFNTYPPPLLVSDFQVLYQEFLI
jgi:hypothetical protein